MTRFLPLLLAVPTFAATITFEASTPGTFNGIPTGANTQSTNWNQSVNLNKFDTALGTLTNVSLQLVGGVFGSVRLESLDGTPAAINYSLSAQVSATGISGLSVLVLPAATGTFNAAAHDGSIDFGGTSGITLNNLSNTDTNSSSSVAPLVLAAYSGGPGDTFAVALAATGLSSTSGGGNLATLFGSNAGALVRVTYTYDEPSGATPEPATFAFVGAALVAAGLLRRK